MSLRELISRLAKEECVDAIAVIGSAAQEDLDVASDYDLLIILKDAPLPLSGGVTLVEGRVVDILFMNPNDIEELIEARREEIRFGSIRGSVVRWMRSARIEVDKSHWLTRLQEGPRRFRAGTAQ